MKRQEKTRQEKTIYSVAECGSLWHGNAPFTSDTVSETARVVYLYDGGSVFKTSVYSCDAGPRCFRDEAAAIAWLLGDPS